MMDRATIARYQRGGDIWVSLADQYGAAAADSVAQVALSGDRAAVTDAVTRVRSGPPLNESTTEIFWRQVTTDPLAAPLESANRAIGTVTSSAILGLFKNPWVLAALAIGLFLYFGGGKILVAKALKANG